MERPPHSPSLHASQPGEETQGNEPFLGPVAVGTALKGAASNCSSLFPLPILLDLGSRQTGVCILALQLTDCEATSPVRSPIYRNDVCFLRLVGGRSALQSCPAEPPNLPVPRGLEVRGKSRKAEGWALGAVGTNAFSSSPVHTANLQSEKRRETT